MAKRKKFKIYSEPVKPERRKAIRRCYSVYSEQTLAKIIEWFSQYDVSFENIKLDLYSDYDCDLEIEFYCHTPETDLEYNPRYSYYKTKLKKYNKWLSDNQEQIKIELEIREKEELEKRSNQKQREEKAKIEKVKKLQREIKKLQTQLKQTK